MPVYGPYASDGDTWIVKYDDDGGRKRSKRFKDRDDAFAFATARREAASSPSAKPPSKRKRAKRASIAAQERAAASPAAWAWLLWMQAQEVIESGADPLQVARTVATLATSAKHFADIVAQEERLVELEDRLAQMIAAQRLASAGAHTRAALSGARAPDSPSSPIH